MYLTNAPEVKSASSEIRLGDAITCTPSRDHLPVILYVKGLEAFVEISNYLCYSKYPIRYNLTPINLHLGSSNTSYSTSFLVITFLLDLSFRVIFYFVEFIVIKLLKKVY